MPSIKLSKSIVESINATGKRLDYFDTEIKGFSLRVSSAGDKSYSVLYRIDGIKKRYTIGKYPTIPFQQAKKEAQRLLLLVSQGEDIQQAKKAQLNTQQELTFIKFLNTFYLEWFKNNRKQFIKTKNDLLNSCQALHPLTLESLDKTALNKFIYEYKTARNVSNARLNRIIASVKGAISRAAEFGYIDENKLSGFKQFKESDNTIRYLEDIEIERLFSALSETNGIIVPVTMTAYYTGMRRGEIFSLEWKDINFKLKQIILDKDNTKSGKSRIIPIHNKLLDILLKLKDERKNNYVFASPVTGDKLDNIAKSWSSLMKKAKIENFRFHDLRHNFASQLIMKGESLSVVRELLGHSDFKMTLRYAHLAPEHKQKAVNLL